VPKLIAVKQQLVLFFQSTMCMDLIEQYFHHRGYKYLRLDGSASSEQRTEAMKLFGDPNAGYYIFMATTRAGGQGINLQSAATVIHFESDWNPHADQQAQARYASATGADAHPWVGSHRVIWSLVGTTNFSPASTHRLGQRQEVRIFRFIVDKSVEELIVERAQHKLNIDEKVRAVEYTENSHAVLGIDLRWQAGCCATLYLRPRSSKRASST